MAKMLTHISSYNDYSISAFGFTYPLRMPKNARYSILVSDSIDKTVVPCEQSCVATSVVGKMVAERETNDAIREIISYSTSAEVEQKTK